MVNGFEPLTVLVTVTVVPALNVVRVVAPAERLSHVIEAPAPVVVIELVVPEV